MTDINRKWPDFKKLLNGTEKSLHLQYETGEILYSLLAVDQSITYDCQIFLDGKEPSTWASSDVTDHTSWRTDFETNFKPGSNKIISIAATAENVQLFRPQPQKPGYEMCDRDFKFVTCKVTQATAVEDLKINTVTLKEESWAGPELALVGVYKDGTPNRIICTDQDDADANGVLSVFDYQAYNQTDGTTKIPYNIRSGAIVKDPAIPAAERLSHRAYVIAVPGLGPNYYVRLFDGYLAGYPEGILDVESPAAKMLDPALAPVANVLRIYIAHPQGQSNAHILWLLTYRPTGTF